MRITDADGAPGLGQFDSDSLRRVRPGPPRDAPHARSPADRSRPASTGSPPGTRSGTTARRPDMPGVRSALDIAQWDLVARRAGVPLHELIAPGERPGRAALARVRLAPHAREPGRVRGRGRPMPGRGVRGVQDPCVGRRGPRPRGDPRGARRRRRRRGAHLRRGGVLRSRTAERMAPALGDLGVRWFEAPLPDLDLEGYRRLMRLGSVAIVPAGDAIWDERLMTEHPARSAVVGDAVRRDVRRRHHVRDPAVRGRGARSGSTSS